MTMHLDSQTIAALLDGTLPPDEARALSAHLDGDCEQCELLLSVQTNVDGLDGLADASIASALPSAAGVGNDLEFARITRALHERRSAPRRFIIPSAVAAALLIAGVAGLAAHQLRAPRADVAAWDGAKGFGARAIPVRLRFLAMGEGGRIEKGISGEPVDAGSSLLFEVEAARAADLALARVSPDGTTEVIWRRRVEGGRTQVEVRGRPAAYPLTGLSGPQRFVLVASESGLDELRAQHAARALAPPGRISGDSPELEGLSLDVVEISVY